jgi:hypothetical protein
MTYDLGSLPDWLQGLGTVGAFAIAIVIYLREVKDRQRSQAALISGWWSRVDPGGQDIGSIGNMQPTEEVGFRLWVKNSSQEAVYDCFLLTEATLEEASADGEIKWFGRFAYFLNGQIIVSAGIIPPGESLQYFLDGEHLDSLGAMTIIFRDAAGRSWRREHGRLEINSEARTRIGQVLSRIVRR